MRKILAVLLAIGCSTDAMSQSEVRIGVASYSDEGSATLWNPSASFFEDGINLALTEYAPELAKNGLKVTFVPFALPSDKPGVLAVSEKIIKSDVVAVIGYPFSSDLLAAGSLFANAKITVVSPAATADRVRAIGPYVRTTVFSNQMMARILAAESWRTGIRSVGIVYDADHAYSQNLRASFINEFSLLGGKIAFEVPILSDSKDFSKVADVAKRTPADGIFLPNFEFESASAIAAIYDAGVRPKLWIGGDAWGAMTSGFQRILGDRRTEAIMVAPWHSKLKDAQSTGFVERFSQVYKKTPHDIAALAYTAAKYVMEALTRLKNGPANKKSFFESIRSISQFDGLTGPVKYKPESGTPDCPAVLLHATNGQIDRVKRRYP